MAPKYALVPAAAGASRLYAASGSTALVAEHRAWLDEAYRDRAAEVPGVLRLIRADGTPERAVSGWALGGPVDDTMTWLEETGEEYRYRIARTAGPGSPLAPPDDYWAVAGAVGHVASSLGAVVLWRPARGASARDPLLRRDELWIASVDRKTGDILGSRELALTLPRDRAHGILLGGPSTAPILLLLGLPEPGGPGAYRAVGLRLPSLETAWELTLDVAAFEGSRESSSSASPSAGASIPPPPPTRLTGDDLRTLYGSMGAPLGAGSGWLVAHGHVLRGVLVVDSSILVSADGKATPLRELRLTGTDELSPIVGEPGVLLLGKVGPRGAMHLASVDAVWPGRQRVETLADEQTEVQGRKLGEAPDLIPMSAALVGDVLFVAPPIGGADVGAGAKDVRGQQTTPTAWHHADRPRVVARQQWLEDRARP